MRAPFLIVLGCGSLGACLMDFDDYDASGVSTQTTAAGGQGGSGGNPTGGGNGGTGGDGGGTGGSGGSIGPCGNATLDAGESCDDGNSAAGDGCDASCAIEGTANMCPSGTTILLGAEGIWLTSTTEGVSDIANTMCGGNTAGDLIYAIQATQAGNVDVTLSGDFEKVLSLRDDCNNGPDNCADGTGDLGLTRAVTADETFHVLVSGVSGDEGEFTLQLAYE